MYWVYVLENRDDESWYIGFTTNIRQRFHKHNAGEGGATTSRKPNWKLIYLECYANKQDALSREKFLKSGSGRRYLKKQMRHYLENQDKLKDKKNN